MIVVWVRDFFNTSMQRQEKMVRLYSLSTEVLVAKIGRYQWRGLQEHNLHQILVISWTRSPIAWGEVGETKHSIKYVLFCSSYDI